MSDDEFSWASLGNNPLNDTSSIKEMITKLDRNYIEIQNSKMETERHLSVIFDKLLSLEKQLEFLPLQLENLTLRQQPQNTIYDERDIAAFMPLSELGIGLEERPDEETDENLELVPVVTVDGGFTAPPPTKNADEDDSTEKKTDPLEGLTVEEEVDKILEAVWNYCKENGAIMNFHFKPKGIVPKGHVISKEVKELLKAEVAKDDSLIKLHKFGKMRGMYYIGADWEDVDPEEIYEQTYNS